ncbi:Uncharacterized protein HZ326_25252 [Fusarium oxysporum f. sp. albedinis]|nr:Uncharacterized protein HZ326_25252 [Fusarium oxysporum f. sp. albedinis]
MLFGSLSQLEYEESLESSTLTALIEKRDPACVGQGSQPKKAFQVAKYDLLSRLRIFIEAKAPRPSIWKLRHFLAIDDVSVESAVLELA